MKSNNVIILGWGQVTKKMKIKLDPIELMKEAALKASLQNTKDILNKVEGIFVVRPLSFNHSSFSKKLAKQLNISPKITYDSGIGGHTPQLLVNKISGMIARDELNSALLVGAETFYSKNTNRKISLFQGIPKDYQKDDVIGSTSLESQYGISMPLDGFPLFETALWSDSNLSLENYLKKIGSLIKKLNEVAVKHHNAWDQEKREIKEIIYASKLNPEIAFPYTKLMCSLLSVNMGAAIIISKENMGSYSNCCQNKVYFIAGGYAQDQQRFLIEKNNFNSSLALKKAVDKTLTRAFLSLDDIECFDFYSCFPCVVFIAKKMLKIPEKDQRPLTLTGGLPCFGGPGNNYSLHAIVTLADMISSGKVKNGIITSLGWFMHKHAVGLYASTPSHNKMIDHDLEDSKNFLVGNIPVEAVDNFSGKATIETYTVHNYKKEQPIKAIVYANVSNNLRTIAHVRDIDMINTMMNQCYVGKKISIKNNQGKNIGIIS